MTSNNQLTLGMDGEVFLQDPQTNKYISAIDRVGGSKKHPFKVHLGAFQEDNVMAEINIDPAIDALIFSNNIQGVLNQLQKKVSPLLLSFNPSVMFEPDQIYSNPKAMESGCDPDYNIYTLTYNPLIDLSESFRRYAGGHVHFGSPLFQQKPTLIRDLVQLLDLFVALPLALLDNDNYRKQLYGSLGNYRPKPYGVEYRSLSNIWMETNSLRIQVFDKCSLAFHYAINNKNIYDFCNQSTINSLPSIIQNNTKIKSFLSAYGIPPFKQ